MMAKNLRIMNPDDHDDKQLVISTPERDYYTRTTKHFIEVFIGDHGERFPSKVSIHFGKDRVRRAQETIDADLYHHGDAPNA
jgi:hypothetical protein